MTTTIKLYFGGLHMENYCAFSKNHNCLKRIDYKLTRQELKKSDTLRLGNWIEIQTIKPLDKTSIV